MGFRANTTTFALKWPPGHRLHGLEISARSCPIGELMELGRLSAAVKAGQVNGAVPVDAVAKMLDAFGGAIKAWNLEDEDGNPVPPGRAGLEHLDLSDVLEAVLAWAQAISQVPDPLGTRSTPNGTPPIPMQATPAAPSS